MIRRAIEKNCREKAGESAVEVGAQSIRNWIAERDCKDLRCSERGIESCCFLELTRCASGVSDRWG